MYQVSPFRIIRVISAGLVYRSFKEPLPVPTTAQADVHVRNSHYIFLGRADSAAASAGLLQGYSGTEPAVKLSPLPAPIGYSISVRLDARTGESAWFCMDFGFSELCFAIGMDGTALGPFRPTRYVYDKSPFIGSGISTSSVSVYKSIGSRQCTQGGVSLGELKRQLTQAGIAVRRATCAFDGSKYPTVCGEPDGAIGILDVPVSQLADATRHGYALLSELTGPVQAGPCPAGRD